MRDLSAISPFLHEVRVRLGKDKPFLIALDGRCGSGKSALAAQFQRDFQWNVAHLDDFFLRPEQRTQERLAEPGGNVDYERFLAEVLIPLREGRPAEYRPYDCHTGGFGPPVRLEPAGVTVVEGSYACHPAFWDYYDLRVFLTLTPDVQLRRLALREGEERLQSFVERWIPLEERYFAAFDIENRCDYRLET